jgi:arsenite methyltransferase
MIGNLREAPDLGVARERYRRLAGLYDAACRPIEPLRRAAIDLLELRSGETVCDVACGTGAALPELARRVGIGGRVIGIEPSPEMARRAAGRFAGGALPPNVDILLASAEEARLETRADALLFSFTHDVLQSARAVDNILAHARPGARIAVLGMCLLPWWWGGPINLWKLWSGRRYLTTYAGLSAPWTHLAQRAEGLQLVGRFHFGTSYLATARTRW